MTVQTSGSIDSQMSFSFDAAVDSSKNEPAQVQTRHNATAVACLATRRSAFDRREEIDAYARVMDYASRLRRI